MRKNSLTFLSFQLKKIAYINFHIQLFMTLCKKKLNIKIDKKITKLLKKIVKKVKFCIFLLKIPLFCIKNNFFILIFL